MDETKCKEIEYWFNRYLELVSQIPGASLYDKIAYLVNLYEMMKEESGR